MEKHHSIILWRLGAYGVLYCLRESPGGLRYSELTSAVYKHFPSLKKHSQSIVPTRLMELKSVGLISRTVIDEPTENYPVTIRNEINVYGLKAIKVMEELEEICGGRLGSECFT